MTQELEFRPFKSQADKGWDRAWEIYVSSFPRKERRALEDHIHALEDPLFSADGIWRGDEFVGIIYYWQTELGYYYGEHLAIVPELRGQDMGSKTLSAFCRKVGNIILEIDPPVDEISVRRLHFYQRLGFIENAHEYVHPSFSKPFEPHKLVLMSYPDPIDADTVKSVEDFVRSTILKYSDHNTTK